MARTRCVIGYTAHAEVVAGLGRAQVPATTMPAPSALKLTPGEVAAHPGGACRERLNERDAQHRAGVGVMVAVDTRRAGFRPIKGICFPRWR
jgi:hypothetical protein